MIYTKDSLYKGFQFRELASPYRSAALIQTVKKVYRSERYTIRVLCLPTECGIVEFDSGHLLKGLSDGTIVEYNEVYEIY